MRLNKGFFVIMLLLSGCSIIEMQPVEEDMGPSVEEVPTEEPTQDPAPSTAPISEEEKLIAELPEAVHPMEWNLILVNPWEALPDGFETELAEVDNEQQVDARIAEEWNSWKQTAHEAGHRLFFASGFRTVDRQRNNFNQRLQSYLNEGLSEEEALVKTKEYLTEPGHSEHHTGLALDIVDEEWINAGHGLDPEYATQASQQWMVETMAEHGFILRYPEGKETITGIQYEPWHFRYVGVENALFIDAHDLTLEEYIELLKIREES